MGKKLVAFYSWGGNTKDVAGYIAQKTGADLLELTPVRPILTIIINVWMRRERRSSLL